MVAITEPIATTIVMAPPPSPAAPPPLRPPPPTAPGSGEGGTGEAGSGDSREAGSGVSPSAAVPSQALSSFDTEMVVNTVGVLGALLCIGGCFAACAFAVRGRRRRLAAAGGMGGEPVRRKSSSVPGTRPGTRARSVSTLRNVARSWGRDAVATEDEMAKKTERTPTEREEKLARYREEKARRSSLTADVPSRRSELARGLSERSLTADIPSRRSRSERESTCRVESGRAAAAPAAAISAEHADAAAAAAALEVATAPAAAPEAGPAAPAALGMAEGEDTPASKALRAWRERRRTANPTMRRVQAGGDGASLAARRWCDAAAALSAGTSDTLLRRAVSASFVGAGSSSYTSRCGPASDYTVSASSKRAALPATAAASADTGRDGPGGWRLPGAFHASERSADADSRRSAVRTGLTRLGLPLSAEDTADAGIWSGSGSTRAPERAASVHVDFDDESDDADSDQLESARGDARGQGSDGLDLDLGRDLELAHAGPKAADAPAARPGLVRHRTDFKKKSRTDAGLSI